MLAVLSATHLSCLTIKRASTDVCPEGAAEHLFLLLKLLRQRSALLLELLLLKRLQRHDDRDAGELGLAAQAHEHPLAGVLVVDPPGVIVAGRELVVHGELGAAVGDEDLRVRERVRERVYVRSRQQETARGRD